jgi:hypothetical protein
MFHDDTILKLKCRTFEPAKYIGWINQVSSILTYVFISFHSKIAL